MMVDAPLPPQIQIRPRKSCCISSSRAVGRASFFCFVAWFLVFVPWIFVRYGRYEVIRDACNREVGADVVAFYEEPKESSCLLTLQWRGGDDDNASSRQRSSTPQRTQYAMNFTFADAPTVCGYYANTSTVTKTELPTPFPQRTCYREGRPQNLRLMGCPTTATEEAAQPKATASRGASAVMWAHYPGWNRRHDDDGDDDKDSCEEIVVSPTDVRDARRASLALFVIMIVFGSAAVLCVIVYVSGGLDGIIAAARSAPGRWASSFGTLLRAANNDGRDRSRRPPTRPQQARAENNTSGGDVALLPQEFVKSDDDARPMRASTGVV